MAPGLGWAAQAAKPAFDEKTVASFYRGKTVRIIVGFSAGGGYDQYSRVIARHLAKYIPGSPAVIVDNMPGAGSDELRGEKGKHKIQNTKYKMTTRRCGVEPTACGSAHQKSSCALYFVP